MLNPTRAHRLFPLILVIVLVLPVPVLRVTADSGTYCSVLPTHGTHMLLSYVHSVEKTMVEEEYDVRPSGIVMQAMAWQSFGAGLPEEYDEVVDGRYVKHGPVPVGRNLTYWFLPVNDVVMDIGTVRVFEGPQNASKLIVSVTCLPVFVYCVETARADELPL